MTIRHTVLASAIALSLSGAAAASNANDFQPGSGRGV
jgi:hypothetical protein